ncbi:hypothetical protein Tco_0884019 [Tanacetum coccineum]
MTKSKSFNKSPKNKALYHAFMESILEDEEAMDEGVAKKLKKRKPDDADKDEGPFAGSDRGFKRQRTSKGTETSKKMFATKDSSKGKSPATSLKSFKSGKSAKDQVEELIFVQDSDYAEHDDADMPRDQGENLGKTDKQPDDEAVPKNDWYKKSNSDTSPDPEWNEGKLVNDGPEQMSSQGRQIVPADFFFNNDLEYLRGGSNDKKYTASTTNSNAARYDLKGIEDMVPNLWSPIKVVYDRYAILGISHWRTKR